MGSIVLVDTSILLNVFNVPGRAQDREAVLDQLEKLIDRGDHLFIPIAAVFETGNHIAHVPAGHDRRTAAERFVFGIRDALNDRVPWKPISFPSHGEFLQWLEAFPDSAMRGVGMGDLSVVKEWESCCQRFSMSRVWIWSLDGHLQGYDSTFS